MRQSVGIHTGILKEVRLLSWFDDINRYPYTAEEENVAAVELWAKLLMLACI